VNLFGRPRLLSNAELARARALYRSGTQQTRIADLFGVSYRTLHRRLRTPYKQQERRW
jgi:DNA invertase Pin-like site-specific DNA recombinase